MNIPSRTHRRLRTSLAQYIYYSDGISVYRKGITDNEFLTEIHEDNNYEIPAETLPQYRYYSDGETAYRDGVSDGEFITEQWTDGAFDLPALSQMPQYRFYSNGVYYYRDGVSDGEFVINQSLIIPGIPLELAVWE